MVDVEFTHVKKYLGNDLNFQKGGYVSPPPKKKQPVIPNLIRKKILWSSRIKQNDSDK